MASRLLHYHQEDLDAAVLRLSSPRKLTQEISRKIFQETDSKGERIFAGLKYQSRLGDEVHNFAVFEPTAIRIVRIDEISPDDHDLIYALETLQLRLGK